MMTVKIVIATHKEYDMPKEDIYLPVFVGASLNDLDLPYQRDNEGDNISNKNKTYCELTGLYWAYKNLKADYIGLCHYRRYLDLKGIDLSKEQIVLPKKRHYYIETVYDQFGHAHGFDGLRTVRKIIMEDYPDYLRVFDECMNKKSLHIYNMFVMRYDIFVQYCSFLFNVLFKAEAELGECNRLYGYIGERLLDVFIVRNQYSYVETKVITTERINWLKKIVSFMKRKYLSVHHEI